MKYCTHPAHTHTLAHTLAHTLYTVHCTLYTVHYYTTHVNIAAGDDGYAPLSRNICPVAAKNTSAVIITMSIATTAIDGLRFDFVRVALTRPASSNHFKGNAVNAAVAKMETVVGKRGREGTKRVSN